MLKNAITYSDYEVVSISIAKGVLIKKEYLNFALKNMEFYNKQIIETLLKNIKKGFNKENLFMKALSNNDIETIKNTYL